MNANILVVEDEAAISDLLEIYLKNDGFTVSKCSNGKDAKKYIDMQDFDLAILDIMLPDISGLEICKYIRINHGYPVIMLTAKSEEIDKITGLTIGADDYITKPFRPLEVLARMKAQIRRCQKYNYSYYDQKVNSDKIDIGDLYINESTREFKLKGKLISLTPTEFKIMWALCQNAGRVVSGEELLKVIWGNNYYEDGGNSIVVHIRHIRKKIDDTAEHSKYIKTVWGVGYIIENQ